MAKTPIFTAIGGVFIVLMALLVFMGQRGCALASPVDSSGENESKELRLIDYPKSFGKDAMMVVRANATDIERASIEAIAKTLGELTENEPVIKKAAEVSEKDKANHSLILAGTPGSLALLQEVYDMTKAMKVTEEYPGENKGLLEILRSPWNNDRSLLLVAGSDDQGVMIGLLELYYLTLSKVEFNKSGGGEVTIKGVVKSSIGHSWNPQFDQCTTAPPILETELGDSYYLANICPYVSLLPGEKLINSKVIVEERGTPALAGEQVEVKGKIEKREVSVPLEKEPNSPTKMESFDVIVVGELRILADSNQ